MIRSPGFGSRGNDFFAVFSDSLSRWLRMFLLNRSATSSKSPAHTSTGTRSVFTSHSLSAYGFMFYFTPYTRVLFTFPSQYYFAIGHPGVFSLTRWSSLIHTGFHVPHATRDKTSASPPRARAHECARAPHGGFSFFPFNYWTFTIYGAGFSCFVY